MNYLTNKHILVTGASGLVGTNLLRRLATLDVRVRATVHRQTPKVESSKIECVKADLTNQDDCHRVAKDIDLVYHCAANTSGAAMIENSPMAHVTPNTVMNVQLLDACYKAGVKKFLWLSSSTGYPEADHPVIEDEMMDGEPYAKYFFVGWMKRYTEVLCRMYAQKLKSPMLTVVLRPTNIYGEDDDFEFATSHVLPALVRKVVERHDPLEVWGTGDDVRDLIYVDDFVDACILAMEKVDRYGAFNIGLGQGHSVKDILSILTELEDFHPQITFNTDKPQMIPVRLVDIAKAKETFGFEPKTPLREGIKKTLYWYKNVGATGRSPATN